MTDVATTDAPARDEKSKEAPSGIRRATAMDVPLGRAAIAVGSPDSDGNYPYADIEPFGGVVGSSYATQEVDGRPDLLLVDVGGRWLKVSVDQPGAPGYLSTSDQTT